MKNVDRHIGRFHDEAARDRFVAAYDRGLAAWPTPPAERDVATRFGATHVVSSGAGSGTPIVLLHGMAVSSASWFASISAFAADRRVFAIDTISDAGRSVQTARVRDGADMAAWLDDVLGALDLERVHVVGLSYGGWLALNQGIRSPARLASITAVDPAGAIGGAQGRFLLEIVPDSFLAAVAKSDKALHRLLRRLNNGTTPTQPLLDLSVAGLRSFVAKPPFPKRMSDDELRAIRVPTLVLFCECSPVNHANRAADRARELIADAAAEVVSGAGHMLPVQEPTRFTDRVLEFIRSVDGA